MTSDLTIKLTPMPLWLVLGYAVGMWQGIRVDTYKEAFEAQSFLVIGIFTFVLSFSWYYYSIWLPKKSLEKINGK